MDAVPSAMQATGVGGRLTVKLSQIPMLSGGSKLGHVDEYKNHRLSFLRRAVTECGPIARAVLLRQMVIVNDPQIMRELLVEKARSFRKSPVLRLVLFPLAGEGLFTSDGALWKGQRRLMAPMFHHDQVASFAECMTQVANRSAAQMNDGETISVAKATTQIAMSVVGKALFDAETFDEADELGHALTVALAWSDSQIATWPLGAQVFVRAWLERVRDGRWGRGRTAWAKRAADQALRVLEAPVRYHLAPGDRTMREAIRTIDARVARMISVRRAAGLDRHDLLTQLLRARDEEDGGSMTDRQVRDEAVTLFVAGHETTAAGLAWAFHELAKHPEIRGRVQREADRFAGRTPSLDELREPSLCARVFKEALRLYPPVYAFGRQALEDVSIGGYEIPKGMLVLASAYGQHRNPAVYPDPDRFDPDRFLPAAEAARHKTAWLPFGAGPRVCIGNHFALLEGQLVLAALSHRVTLEPKPGVNVVPAPVATLRPSEGMPMIVRRRDSPKVAATAL
jgi:cytochrome P450